MGGTSARTTVRQKPIVWSGRRKPPVFLAYGKPFIIVRVLHDENGICITTNAIEGYFSTLKRGINGVHHLVEKQRLHCYLSEFDFRYNACKITDGCRYFGGP
jgi:hypothetical protein